MDGNAFLRAHEGDTFCLLLDARKCINGVKVKVGRWDINRTNRGISEYQMFPFWSMSSILYGSGPKLVDPHLQMKGCVQKYHYICTVEIPYYSKIQEPEKYQFYANNLMVKGVTLISEHPVWKNRMKWEGIIHSNPSYIVYIPSPPDDLCLRAIRKSPLAIFGIRKQTLPMWKEFFEEIESFQNSYMKFVRIPENVTLWKMGIAQHLKVLTIRLQQNDIRVYHQAINEASAQIKGLLVLAPQKLRYELHADLEETFRFAIGDSSSIARCVSGEEFNEESKRELTPKDRYIVLLTPDYSANGQKTRPGLNVWDGCLSGREEHGFMIMTPEAALRNITSYQKDGMNNDPYSTKRLRYYYSHYGFVSIPDEARMFPLIQGTDKTGGDPQRYLVDSLWLERPRPLEQLFLFHSDGSKIVAEYGDLLCFLPSPTKNDKMKGCLNCPRSIFACQNPDLHCYRAAMNGQGDPSGLLFYPDPPKSVVDEIGARFRVDVRKYLP